MGSMEKKEFNAWKYHWILNSYHGTGENYSLYINKKKKITVD